MGRSRVLEYIDLDDVFDDLLNETCLNTGLGKKRVFELALFQLAERLEAKDPAALAALDAWKKARTFIEVTEDAINVAKLRG